MVAGHPTSRAELTDGDVIELGSTLFLFRRMTVRPGLIADKELGPPDPGDLATLCPALEHSVAHMARIAASRATPAAAETPRRRSERAIASGAKVHRRAESATTAAIARCYIHASDQAAIRDQLWQQGARDRLKARCA